MNDILLTGRKNDGLLRWHEGRIGKKMTHKQFEGLDICLERAGAENKIKRGPAACSGEPKCRTLSSMYLVFSIGRISQRALHHGFSVWRTTGHFFMFSLGQPIGNFMFTLLEGQPREHFMFSLLEGQSRGHFIVLSRLEGQPRGLLTQNKFCEEQGVSC